MLDDIENTNSLDPMYVGWANDIEVAFREFDGAVPYKVKPIPTRAQAIHRGISLLEAHLDTLKPDDSFDPKRLGRIIGEVVAAIVDYCLGIDAPTPPTD